MVQRFLPSPSFLQRIIITGAGICLLSLACDHAVAQTVPLPGSDVVIAPGEAEGNIVADFTLPRAPTQEPIDLYDYSGYLIVLEFFTEWCAPSNQSAPAMESQIQEYYDNLGGTPNGFPVKLIQISSDQPDNYTKMYEFIRTNNLSLALEDLDRIALKPFDTGRIPLFVVINGSAAASNFAPWEVVHHDHGWNGATTVATIRDALESVQLNPLGSGVAPEVMRSPTSRKVPVGDEVILEALGRSLDPMTYAWRRVGGTEVLGTGPTFTIPSATPGDTGEYEAVISNQHGSVVTQPGSVFVSLVEDDRYTVRAEGLPLDFTGGSAETKLTVPDGIPIRAVGLLELEVKFLYEGFEEFVNVTLTSPDGKQHTMIPTGYHIDRLDHEGAWITRWRVGLEGANISGEWTLSLKDSLFADSGTLLAWKMEFMDDGVSGGSGMNLPADIPGLDFDTFEDGHLESTIELRPVPGAVSTQDLLFSIDFDHPDLYEVEIVLTSPEGTEAVLVEKFAAASIGETHYVVDKESVANRFAGENWVGAWTLSITNTSFSGYTGTLNSWALSSRTSDRIRTFEEWLVGKGFPSSTDPDFVPPGANRSLLLDFALEGVPSGYGFTRNPDGTVDFHLERPFARYFVNYRLEVSEDLKFWQPVDFGAPEYGENRATFEKRIPDPGAALFTRLKVVRTE